MEVTLIEWDECSSKCKDSVEKHGVRLTIAADMEDIQMLKDYALRILR